MQFQVELRNQPRGKSKLESMTTKQVKEYLQVKRTAISTLIKKGILNPVKVGNRLLFVAAEVRAVLTANQKAEQ